MPSARAGTLMNLANRIAEQDGDLGVAVSLYEHALQLVDRAEFPELWGQVQHNLALAWRDRTDGDPATNLERAIKAYECALEVRSGAPWAATAASLAGALLERLEGVAGDNVERAIELSEQALGGLQGLRRARVQHNLVIAYARRDAAGDFERALAAGAAALTVRTRAERPAEWASTTAELAQVHAARGDLEQAIALYRSALEALDGHPEERARVAFNFSLALGDCGAYAEAERWVRVALPVLRTEPAQHRMALAKLGDYAFEQREWSRATDAYAAALELGAQVFQSLGSEAVRRREVRQSWHVHARACYALLRRGRVTDAVIALDRGKARLLGDRLGLAPEAALDVERILALTPVGGALVMPVVTPAGGAVLVFRAECRTPSPEDVLWLDGLTDLAVVELLAGAPDAPLGGWFGAYLAGRGALPGSPGRLTWEERIATAAADLWTLVMGPVHERLRCLGLERGAPVAVIPQGGLSLLPLAAAGPFIDDFTVVIAPSAAPLAAGRDGDRPTPSILTVADPVGDLPYARVEGHLVAAMFDAGDLLIGDAARRGAVAAAAGRHPYIHVASHGAHSWDDALASTLSLADGDVLTLREINADWRLDASRLVVLSACETGLTEPGRLIDEYVGLPAGLLRAGAAAVISTLWTVDDATTALLMADFYRRHIRCGEDSASALRAAQRWLRDLDRDAALAALEPARAVCARRLQGGNAGDVRMWSAIENLRDDLLTTWQPNDRPWGGPYYWAGFVHVGASQPGHAVADSGSP